MHNELTKDMTKKQIDKMLRLHGKWLRGKDGGKVAIFKDEDFSYYDFTGRDLTKVSFIACNFTGANCCKTNFTGAALNGSNFTGAKLFWANLTSAEVIGANFTGADLTGANLLDLYFPYKAWFADVEGKPIYQVTNIGRHGRTLTVIAEGSRGKWIWHVGCFRGSEADLAARVKDEYEPACDYVDAMRYLIKIAKRNAHKFL